MELLRENQIRIEPMGDGVHVLVSLYEHEGYRYWDKYHLSDFPNNLISLDDLKRFGIEE